MEWSGSDRTRLHSFDSAGVVPAHRGRQGDGAGMNDSSSVRVSGRRQLVD
ncbi:MULTISPECIES: hypothetical protein [Rhodococcus]|uniref:Uncharacterized protein n=1 Tax=Rhodococcus parequi TaxID=3137122 RepID=A0ABW9FAB9_9NOCA